MFVAQKTINRRGGNIENLNVHPLLILCVTSVHVPEKMYRLLKKYGPEITWTRIMMDQNNYGPFGIFFFYGPIFLVRHMCGVFLYLSRILTGSRAREARATTACVGRKLGMGLPGHI